MPDWLDDLLIGLRTVLSAGATVTSSRRTINFASPLAATDDATNDRVNVGLASGFSALADGTVNGQPVAWSTGSSAWGLVSGVVLGTNYIAIGVNPAQTGPLRIPNAAYIYGRNAANGADLALCAIESDNSARFGSTDVANVYSVGSSAWVARLGGSTRWQISTTTATASVPLDMGGKAVTNFRNDRGNSTSLPGSGSGDVALKLTADTTTLTLTNLVDDDEANTIGFRVRVEDADGSDAKTDEFVFHLRRAAGDIQVTDGAGSSDSGATAQLTPTGPDSGYSYTLDVSDTGNTIALALTDDAAQARVARVTSWWDEPEDVS